MRRLCLLHARADIGDQAIGQILSAAPIGKDGVWPCETVREVIEELGSRQISAGVYQGVFNSGGVIRGASGVEECKLAESYKAWALRVSFDFPFVSTMLRDIASSFERHSEWMESRDEYQVRLTN